MPVLNIDKLERLRLDIIRLYTEVVSDSSLQPDSKVVVDLLWRMTEYGSTGLIHTNNRAVVEPDCAVNPDDKYHEFLQFAVAFCELAKNNEVECVASLCSTLTEQFGLESLTT